MLVISKTLMEKFSHVANTGHDSTIHSPEVFQLLCCWFKDWLIWSFHELEPDIGINLTCITGKVVCTLLSQGLCRLPVIPHVGYVQGLCVMD